MLSVLVERLAITVRSGHLIGPPLLEQLSEARYASVSDKGAGSGGGSQLNDAAVHLWGEITSRLRDDARDWCTMSTRDWHGAKAEDPRSDLMMLHAAFTAAVERGEVTGGQYEALEARLRGFDHRISRLLDPPRLIPLPELVECPVCRFDRITVGKGPLAVRQDALMQTVKPLTVTCRLCDTEWRGAVQIAQLLKAVGIEYSFAALKGAEAIGGVR